MRLIIIALKTRSFAKLSITRQHTVPTKKLRFSNYGELQGKDEVIFIILNPPTMNPPKFLEPHRKAKIVVWLKYIDTNTYKLI